MAPALRADSGITVVIPAYGHCPHLPDVVAALLGQTLPPDQILVGHSGSHDPSGDLEPLDPRVRVLHRDDRMFAGAARNHAAGQARGDWLAFVDSDVRPDPTWLESFADAVRTHGEDCYFAGSLAYARSGGYWGLCLWMIEMGSQHPYLPGGEVPSMAGANGFVKRAHFEAVGGFKDGLHIGEDAALQRELRQRGLKIRFWPGAIARHFNISGFGHFRSHLRPLGAGAARLRRQYAFRGSAAARHPVLALGLFPLRLAQIYARVMRWGRGYRLLLLALTPGLVLGLGIWTAAFFGVAMSARGDDR
ncbi:MAG: glycosyltransferase [Hyphomicrobiales bacterium]|nr:glycosyltransferase [Hyphomicrobiales bacterium]